MPTCFNCRANVLAGVERCPSCGMTFVPGTWRTAVTSLSASADGWGLSRTTRQGRWFQVVALLVPLWVPPLMVFFVYAPATALALLLAPFIFIPGACIPSGTCLVGQAGQGLPRPWAMSRLQASLAFS